MVIWSACLAGFLAVSAGWIHSAQGEIRLGEAVVKPAAGIGPEPASLEGVIAPFWLQGGFELVSDQLILQVGKILFRMRLGSPYDGELVIDHGEFMGLSIVALITLRGTESPFKGTFKAERVLVNYVPSLLFEGRYELKEGKLLLSDCRVGDFYQVEGSVVLSPPYAVDLAIGLNQTPVSDLRSSNFKSAGAQGIQGAAAGKWRVTGPIAALKAKGTLELINGQLGESNPVPFSSFIIQLEGTLPVLVLTDARLNVDQGVLLAKGEVDLRQMGKGNLLGKIQFYSDTKIMRWKGWDIQTLDKGENEGQIQVGKNVGQGMRVSFKGFMNDEIQMQKTNEERGEFGLEYQFQKGKRVKMQIRGHEEFLGVENRVRF